MKNVSCISQELQRIVYQYRFASTEEGTEWNFNVNAESKRLFDMFPASEELNFFLWIAQSVGSLVSDTNNSTISGDADTVRNNVIHTERVSLFGYLCDVSILA